MEENQEVLPEGFQAPLKPSSNIKATKFRIEDSAADTGTLEVIFHNKAHWKYKGVKAEVVDEMMEAESMGKFFNANIKANPQIVAEQVITETEAPK